MPLVGDIAVVGDELFDVGTSLSLSW